MVIQQGRTMEKADVTKGMKRDMIRFGVEHIMSENASDVIDVDIDKIMKEGEVKTAEENAKYAKLGESALRNLTLEEASSVSLYQFEGIDFRTMQKKKTDDQDDLYGFRQRKAVQYVFPTAPAAAASSQSQQPKRDMKILYNYQFYPAELLTLTEEGDDHWIDMSTDTERKQKLLDQGFPNWKAADVKT